MLWLSLSLLTALTVALRDTAVRSVSNTHSAMEIASLELLVSTPLFAAGLLFIEPPALDSSFWWAFFLSFPLNWCAYLLYIKSLTLAPLSLTVPLLSFTPVFMLFSGAFILDEHINFMGTFGIILIVGSCYLLNFDKADKGFFKPFFSIVTNKGSRYMLIVAFIFSFAAAFGKQGMLHSSPLFFSFLFFSLCNLSLIIGLAAAGKVNKKKILQGLPIGLLIGALFFAHVIFHSLAIMQINAAYMIAIKRSSILFSVILGWYLFKEPHFASRGPATLLMFLGAVIITLFG